MQHVNLLDGFLMTFECEFAVHIGYLTSGRLYIAHNKQNTWFKVDSARHLGQLSRIRDPGSSHKVNLHCQVGVAAV